MTNKGLVVALLILIILGGVIYFTLSKETDSKTPPTGATSKTESVTEASSSSAQTPTNTASNDEIVDYLIDGLGNDETSTASAAIDETKPSSQENAAATLNAGL